LPPKQNADMLIYLRFAPKATEMLRCRQQSAYREIMSYDHERARGVTELVGGIRQLGVSVL
jgi:hypothetical protein